MPRRLSAYARERIVCLWQQGKTPASIVRQLNEDGISTTLWTVRHRIFAWTKREGLEDRHRSGRPSTISTEIMAYMDTMLKQDEELSASKMH